MQFIPYSVTFTLHSFSSRARNSGVCKNAVQQFCNKFFFKITRCIVEKKKEKEKVAFFKLKPFYPFSKFDGFISAEKVMGNKNSVIKEFQS